MKRALMLIIVLSTGCHRVSFEVDGERLIMNGTFNTKTPDALRTVLEDNPGLTIAEMVKSKLGAEIVVSASNDPRSYRQDSSKLLATGFTPTHSVADAIDEISEAFAQNALPDGDQCYTVKWMKHLHLEASH